MFTRQIMFYFDRHPMLSFQAKKEVRTVMWQYCDEDIIDHINEHGRYSNKFNNIVKRDNIFILTLHGDQYKDFRYVASIVKTIAENMTLDLHPYKPIANIDLNNYPEWLL